MKAPETLRRLALNTVGVGTGRILSQLLNLALLPVVLAVLSPSVYGAYALLQIAALIGGVLASFGLSTAFVAQFATYRGDRRRLFDRVLTEQALLGTAVLAVQLWIAAPLVTALGLEGYAPVLMLLFAGEWFSNSGLIYARWQMLTERHWQISLVALVRSTILFGLLLILVVWKRQGLLGYAIAELAARAVALGAAALLSGRMWRPRFSPTALGRSLRLGLPATPDAILFWLLVWAPLYVVRQSHAAAAAGALALAWRMTSPLDVVGQSLAVASATQLIRGSRRAGILLTRWWRLGTGVLCTAAFALVTLSPEILGLLFPPEYAATRIVLPAMALGALFLAFYYLEWVGLSGSQRTWGLSAASGAGLATIGAAYSTSAWAADPTTAASFWALGFLAMWWTARVLNPGTRIGRAWVSTGAALGAVSAGVALSWIAAPGWLGWIVKGAALGVWVFWLSAIELFLRRRERLVETGGEDRFLDIPTYAEVARHVQGVRSLLDVGCGEGFFLREVAAIRQVGVERDLTRLHAARRERPDLRLVCADAGALPFRDGAFDGVSLIGVLPYVDPQHALEEAARVVTPEGRLAVSAASTHRLYRWIDVYRRRHPARTYALDELCGLVRHAGFEVEHAYQRGLLLAPLLGSLYAIPAQLDRLLGDQNSNMGRWARLARALTNPIIQLEYELAPGPGYQSFVTGWRRD